MDLFTHPSIGLVIQLVTIIIFFIGLLILMDSIWRVEDRLDRYLKLMAFIFGLFLVKKILTVLGFNAFEDWAFVNLLLDLFIALLFLSAQIKLLIMIRRLSGEGRK